MAVLSRKEQGRLLKKISALAKQRGLREALESIAEDYKEEGQINPKELGLKNLNDMRKLPEPLRKFLKGYVAEEIKAIAKQLSRGVEPSIAFKNTPLFDPDVASTISLAAKSNKLVEVANEVYQMLKKEARYLHEINKILITPALILIFLWAFIAAVALKTIPAFMKSLGGEEHLPPLPKYIYVIFGKNPWFLVLGFLITLFLVYLAFKSNGWKTKALPAFRTFEKFRFITAFRALYPIARSLRDLLNLLAKGGFSQKWVLLLQKIAKSIERGINPVMAFGLLKKEKVLKSSEFSFFEITLQTGDLSALKDLEDELELEMEESIEKTKQIVQVVSLILGAGVIGGLYIGIILSLIVQVQKQI
jgi:type II secretory pathway component PulF